jgi:uncharacterized protein YjbI with pentapeptide repeats
MGGKFWSWWGANKVRAHLASFLIGLLTVLMGVVFWFWYLANRNDVIPLLAPLASLLTGVLTVVVAGFAAKIALQQAETARLRHEEQTKADLQRRITESFTKAVEQLGSDKIEVRLGGIYALERISLESAPDYWTIMEMLTGFVRERAPWKDKPEALQEADYYRLPTDIAAVLTVIKRREAKNLRNFQCERFKNWKLNLRHTDLRGAELSEACLEKADLWYAHLEEAYLEKVHLEEAYLAMAHLEGANLKEAHLEGSNLQYAHLEGANLRSAHLEGAYFWGTYLEGANLEAAHLEGAVLVAAHLEGADLTEAHLEGADLEAAYLEGADLTEAHLEGADLREANGLTQDQLDQALGDAETQLPEGLTRPAHWLSKQDGN